MTFEDKVALVTGSARGIGRVAVNYRRSKELADETARLVRELGVGAHVFHADVGF